MDTAPLQDLRAANQAITRFLSELSRAKASPDLNWNSVHFDSLTALLSRMEPAIRSLPPAGAAGDELARETRIYAANLGLLKKTIEELEPFLREKMRSIEEAVSRLGAARTWSESVKDLST